MADINTESLGLYLPTIDPRNEEQLATQAQTVVFNKSQGLLNDFSDHSPIVAFIQGQAFAGSELLWYVNKLPLALVIKFLEVTGVQRSLGQKAKVSLTFTLSAPRDQPFEIPKGFECISGSRLSFYTDEILIIPAGASSGVVSATAAEEGPQYNLTSYTIGQFTQPLTFLASVTNTEASQGGTAAESVENAIQRALVALRIRNPVSASDFEFQAEQVLGNGSRSKAIGLLGSDKITKTPGAVHVFCLDASGLPANSSQIGQVYQSLSQKIMLGTQLYISPMELLPITGEIIAKLQPQADPAVVADALWTAYTAYLSPLSFKPGESLLIKELEHALRFVDGLSYIDQFKLNDRALNIPMPNAFTLPSADSLKIDLIDQDKNIFSTLRGAGEPADFTGGI
jgi:hypothetical protein